MIGHHQHVAMGQPQLEEWAVLARPLLHVQVNSGHADLQGVTEKRHAARAGQVFDLAQWGGR